MPQLDLGLIKDRAERLRAKAADALSAHLDTMVGRVEGALMERKGLARAANFAAIRLPEDSAPRPGALVNIDVSGHDGRELHGFLTS